MLSARLDALEKKLEEIGVIPANAGIHLLNLLRHLLAAPAWREEDCWLLRALLGPDRLNNHAHELARSCHNVAARLARETM
jgi:hypothetical protein